MEFAWTAHRFSGGLLALDLVNTVVCRTDPVRRTDRFDNPAMIAGFAKAAERFRAGEIAGACLTPPASRRAVGELLELREAIDSWMRPQSQGVMAISEPLADLLEACAVSVRAGPRSLGGAAARSALRLLSPDVQKRVGICPNCDWLFYDTSKNQSRRWCDMAVCGNRAKAKSHYARVRSGG